MVRLVQGKMSTWHHKILVFFYRGAEEEEGTAGGEEGSSAAKEHPSTADAPEVDSHGVKGQARVPRTGTSRRHEMNRKQTDAALKENRWLHPLTWKRVRKRTSGGRALLGEAWSPSGRSRLWR